MFIYCETADLEKQALQIGRDFKIPVLCGSTEPFHTKAFEETPCYLALTDARLELRFTTRPLPPFSIDFLGKELRYRQKRSTRKNEALARAVGLKKNRNPLVFDCTAGIGRDAFILAGLGCSVHLFERNQTVAALLQDGIRRATTADSNEVDRMTLHYGNAIALMHKIAAKSPPQVIYLDPMFPKRPKTAQVKKEMQVLQYLAGPDSDSSSLLDCALHYALERVVCKRPNWAPAVEGVQPSHVIPGKTHRFDVYLTTASPLN